MRRTLQRGNLVKGLQEESDVEKDLIYRDNLDEMCIWMIEEDSVISFTEFKKSTRENIEKYRLLCLFVDGINPKEKRRRWDRLYCLQLLLIPFLNSYGYDFQSEDENYINSQLERIEKKDVFPNLINHIDRYKLSEEPEIVRITKIIG